MPLPGKIRDASKFSPDFDGGDRLEDFNDPGKIRELQTIAHRLIKHVPNTNEIGEREFIIVNLTSEDRLYTKINGKIKYLVWI